MPINSFKRALLVLMGPKGVSALLTAIILLFSVIRSPLAYTKPPIYRNRATACGAIYDSSMTEITKLTKIQDEQDKDKYYYFSDVNDNTDYIEAYSNVLDVNTLELSLRPWQLEEKLSMKNPTECERGQSLLTVFDSALHCKAFKLLSEDTARSSLIVIADDGAVRACASYPSFNANETRINDYLKYDARVNGCVNANYFQTFRLDLQSFFHSDINIRETGAVKAKKAFQQSFKFSTFSSNDELFIADNIIEYDFRTRSMTEAVTPVFAAEFIHLAATGVMYEPYIYTAVVDTVTGDVIEELEKPLPERLLTSEESARLSDSFKTDELLPGRTIWGSALEYDSDYGSGVMVCSCLEDGTSVVLTAQTDGEKLKTKDDVLALYRKIIKLI